MTSPRHELAREALEAGRPEEAEALLSAILEETPDDTHALYYLAAAQLQRHAFGAARQSISRAVALEPGNARFHVALGQVLNRLGEPDAAETTFERALSIEPNNGDAYTNLGAMQFEQARYEEAEFTLRKALIYHPNHRPAAIQLGRCLLRLYRVDEAVSLFHAILQIDPEDANAQVNIGIGCTLLGDLKSAREAFESAIVNDPQNLEAHVNYAHLLLLEGEFERGFAEHEWRLRKTDYRDLGAFHSPMWNGEDITGRSILLWAEQGLGDAIQFVRYAPLVARSAAKVIVECNPLLHRLVERIEGIDEVVALGEARGYDFHIPLMSLPVWHGTTQFPNSTPYLSAPSLAELPGAELPGADGLRVGLVWAGNPDHARDRERSRHLTEFAPLTARKDVTFYALQIGAAAAQSPPDGMELIDLGSGFGDLADTAAAMQALDLVISIDSAPAHLAGALNVPVWILLTRMPDWRWGLKRCGSDWYPSMRIFRDDNGWDDLFQRVARELVEFSPA